MSRAVEVPDDDVAVVDVRLEVRRRLRLVTEPADARVTLNGEKLSGTTPLTLPELRVGDEVELVLERSGYEKLTERVTVPDPEGPWRFALPARQTRWSVEAEPADAVLLVDGRARSGRLEVSASVDRPVAVHVSRPGCTPVAVGLVGTGDPRDKRVVKLSCEELSAQLTVTAARRADVYVDGTWTGQRTTLRAYALPPGPHVVTVRRGETQASFPVELKVGENTRLDTRFR